MIASAGEATEIRASLALALCRAARSSPDQTRKIAVRSQSTSQNRLYRIAVYIGSDGMARKSKARGFGADLVEGMKLVRAHERGTAKLEQVWPKPIDVKAIRKRVKMSQAEFSSA